MTSSILIVCPYCREETDSPEQLCSHVDLEHSQTADINEVVFENVEQLQAWLSQVEESRSDAGYLPNSDGLPQTADEEYYIFCRQTALPQAKKRRLLLPSLPGSPKSQDCQKPLVHDLLSQLPTTDPRDEYELVADENTVSCTAFVHVVQQIDGSFRVTYCLEHSDYCSESQDVKQPSEKRQKDRMQMKRRADLMEGHHHPIIAPRSNYCRFEEDVVDVVNDEEQEAEKLAGLIDVERFQLGSSLVSQRLNTTANKLHNITRELKDLAFDLNSTDVVQPHQSTISTV